LLFGIGTVFNKQKHGRTKGEGWEIQFRDAPIAKKKGENRPRKTTYPMQGWKKGNTEPNSITMHVYYQAKQYHEQGSVTQSLSHV